MKIHPERSGRNPGEEGLPRTEITDAAHEVARAIGDVKDVQRLALAGRGTGIDWESYGTFTVAVGDPAAPLSTRGRSFHADLESEHFHYGDLTHDSPARRALDLARHFDTAGRRKRQHREAQNRLPVPDHVAEDLARYLRGSARRPTAQ